MAVCAKCGNKKLEWVQEFGRWKLYETDTGFWHNRVDGGCHPTAQELDEFKVKKNLMKASSGRACRHGILLDRWCDRCHEE
jgi:hypothetical protein